MQPWGQFAVTGTTSIAGHGDPNWVTIGVLGRVRAGLVGPRSESSFYRKIKPEILTLRYFTVSGKCEIYFGTQRLILFPSLAHVLCCVILK